MTTLAEYSFEPVHMTLSGSSVTNVADQGVSGYTLTAVGAPTYEQESWNGYPAVTFDGTDDALKNTGGGLGNAMIGGADRACYVILAYQITQRGTGGDALWSVGDTGTINTFFRFVEASTPNWEFRKRDAGTGAGAGAGGIGGRHDFNPHVAELVTDGTTYSIIIDGVTVSSGGMDVGDMGTPSTFAIGCLSRSSDSSFCSMRLWRISCHDTVTAAEQGQLRSLYAQYMPWGRNTGGGGDFERRRIL